jgi:hypothetical protein
VYRTKGKAAAPGRSEPVARCTLGFAIFVLLVIAAAGAHAETLTPAQIESPLATIAAGRDSAFGTVVAPAQSLEPSDDRARAVIDRIAREVAAVTTAFATAKGDPIAATKAAIARFSPETAQDGASRSFEGSAPSLSIMRQVLFVPKTGAASTTSAVIAAISQFEHSPKTDDNYYEYSDPANLKASRISDLPGSESSWLAGAQPPMADGKVYALKKCRHIVILGWYCNTSLYSVRALGGVPALVTMLRPMPAGADNPMFTDDRSKNIVDGYTAIYVAVEAKDLILVYNLGIQSKAGAASQQSRLNAGQKDEYRQLLRYLQTKFAIAQLPF